MQKPVLNAVAAACICFACASLHATPQSPTIGLHTDGAVESNESSITPMRFGAQGNSSIDDTAAINAMYTAARKTHESVFLRGRQYRVTGQIDARGVSTIGDGATLIFALDSSTSPNAFSWGGSNTLVTDVNFELANSGTATMQGIINSVTGATNQQFYRNRVTCSTTDRSKVKSNIFGLWVTGTDLDGLYIEGNRFESCTYGVQVNNQAGVQRSVRTNALGKPSSNIHITDNTFIDSTLGINTPHIYVSNVVISDNTITPKSFRLDLPLNVAHANMLTITGNTVTSNASSANGTLHVEDASGAVTITGNVVTVTAKNNGIEVGVRPSVSHDVVPTSHVVITGNHVEGPGSGMNDTTGILILDKGTIDTTISGNYVSDFRQCVNSVDRSNINGNTLARCPAPVQSAKSPEYQNMISE